MSVTATRRARWERGLKRDLIQRTADYMLVGRLLEGLAALLLFTETRQPALATA